MSKRKPTQTADAKSQPAAAAAQPPFEPLAIVGIGCLFPKADSLAAFWGNIRAGVDCITPIPASHWKPADYFAADASAPDMTYAQRGGFLDPYPFDPLKYGISPNNLEATDATQLLGLVVAEQTLRDAGYATAKDATEGRPFDRDRTSVILGVTGTLQLVIPLGARLGHPLWRKALAEAGVGKEVADDVVARIAAGYVPWQENSFPGLLGNVAAGRIANRFDLGGTNCVVDAACASSLSALHMAAMELHAGRADMVLTGGFDAFNDIFMYMCFSKTPALSPTGDSRPFSANCDGTILGDGLGMVALRRLADAQRDGDRIYALIRGIGSSSDGRGNAIYAPSSAGQVKALRSAYAAAGISPATVELVEAHGTGTKVGDLAEATSLGEVYGAAAKAKQFEDAVERDGAVAPWCAVGSVKSMIGHTKAAAGVAGLIKAALALSDKVLPPTLKVEQPLEPLSPGNGPAYVNTVARPWPKRDEHPRRAALSAFGFGGSNFHCVLEESTAEKEAARWDGRVQIVPLTAATTDAIAGQLAAMEADFGPLATPLGDGASKGASDGERANWNRFRARAARLRGAFDRTAECRLVLVVELGEDLAARFAAARRSIVANAGKVRWSTPDGAYFASGKALGNVGVLFPGQGSQYVGMLREAACVFPQMLAALDDANAAFGEQAHGARLSDAVYPIPVFSAAAQAAQQERLRSTVRAQPALAAVEWGAWSVLQAFGVEADAFAGHSFGELVALAAAGRIDPPNLLTLAVARGRAMAAAGTNSSTTDAGAMLAVAAPIDRVRTLLAQLAARAPHDVIVANHNAPEQVVLSGGSPDIERVASEFAAAKIRAVKLPVSAAFHSPRVAAAQREFATALSAIPFRAGRHAVVANTTGDAYPAAPDEAKALLAAQLARPVEFVRSIETLYARGIRTFVEVGPQGKLTSLVRAILGSRPHAALSVDGSGGRRAGLHDLASAVAEIAALGHRIDLAAWDPPSEVVIASRSGKPGLIVPLSGVNYVKPRPALPPRLPAQRATHDQRPAADQSAKGFASHSSASAPPPAPTLPASHAKPAVAAPVQRASHDQRPSADPSAKAFASHNSGIALPPAPPSPSFDPVTPQSHVVRSSQSPRSSMNLDQALRVTEQSILAMERMQQQTAQLQQQYLEGQLVAQKTVEQLVAQQQWLLNAALGAPGAALPAIEAPPVAPPAAPPAPMPAALPAHAPQFQSPQIELPPMRAAAPVPRPLAAVPPPQPAPAARPSPAVAVPHSDAASSAAVPQLGAQLLDIVADKTGYPVESLDLSMSLDADLGIDSIKRVEIMSAVQEHMPEAPIVRPEDLGRLQTLGQIVDFLTASVASAGASAPPATKIAPTAAPPPDRPPPAAATSNAEFASVLIEVVADKTGYPAETLELDMRLDADLGIDSIKRVEIMSALQERMPDAPLVRPDDLGRLQTLRQIVAFLDQPRMAAPHGADPTVPAASLSAASTSANSVAALHELTANVAEPTATVPSATIPPTTAPSATPPSAVAPSPSASSQTVQPPSHPTGLDRRVLRSGPLQSAGRGAIAIDRAAEVWITDDGAGLAEAIRRELIARRVVARVVALDAALATDASARPVAGLCIVAPGELYHGDAAPAAASRFVADAFGLLRRLTPALRATGRASAAVLATVTQIDGQFGLAADDRSPPSVAGALTGALAGIAKTASHEWPEVHCKAFDVALDHEPIRAGSHRKPGHTVESAASAAMAAAIADELLLAGPVEVGVTADARFELALETETLPASAPASAADGATFQAGEVIVVTGGARGVAAEAAVALASAYRAHLVLLGRSPDPVAEPAWAEGITAEADLKRAIVAHHAGGAPLAPKAIDFQCKRMLANRQIAATLARIAAAGGAASYCSVDVRDGAALRATLSAVRKHIGPIRGIVHAAGVLADRLIEDKTDEQFAEVWSTKVDGALALLEATADDELRGIAFFSSSTARFGRKGQVDYAAANEALNKLAYTGQRPVAHACRVVSVNWGPWDGGMVTPQLKKLFASEGVGVIGLDAGARQLVAELAAPATGSATPTAVEVVILGTLDAPSAKSHAAVGHSVASSAARSTANPQLALSFERELSVESCPVLRSHVMNDRAVLPMALMIEWLAHAAMHDNPGQNFLGFDELRVYKGVILDADTSVTMRVLAASPEACDGVESIQVELHTQSTLHARARVLLGSRLAAEAPRLAEPTGNAVPQQTLYDGSRLFHGPELHALISVDHCSASGISALARSAPPPARWLEMPLRGRWLADPMALDGAFQLLIVWCFEQRGAGSLPTRIARYRQFAPQFPATQTRIVARIDRDAPHETAATIEFLDEAGKLIARMEGYECVVDGSLNEAFARNQLPVAIS
jgi:acyl transferase domain-containing protein